MASKARGGSGEGRNGGEASGAANEAGQDEGASKEKGGNQEEDEYDDADYEPEPDEERIGPVKMVAGMCLLGLVGAAITATVTELMPSHMAPQSMMSRAHDAFQSDPDVSC